MVGNAKGRREVPEYDTEGNLTRWTDYGDDQTDGDDVQYDIGYFQDPAKGIVKPNLVTARPPGTGTSVKLRERSATYESHGAVETVTDVVIGGKNPTTGATYSNASALWSYAYDAFGNVQTATDPRLYVLTYGWDTTTKTYRTTTTDSFGYQSSSTASLVYGVPTAVVDINGNIEQFGYDSFGRLETVTGPNDTPSAPTIRYTYSQQPVASTAPFPAYAVASNRDVQAPNDPVEVATFVDGLDRVIEVKRDLEVDGGTSTTVQHQVSGLVVFDSRGRVHATALPVTVPATSPISTFSIAPLTSLTVFEYDTLDRVTEVAPPDMTFTSTHYRLAKPADADALAAGEHGT